MKVPQIGDLQNTLEKTGQLDLSKFTALKEFHYVRLANEHNYQVEMMIESESQSEPLELRLLFKGVQSLKLSFGGSYVQITGLSICSVADRGWEDLKWAISDYENGTLSFYCRSVAISSTGVDIHDMPLDHGDKVPIKRG